MAIPIYSYAFANIEMGSEVSQRFPVGDHLLDLCFYHDVQG